MLTLAALITPLTLATAPMAITVDEQAKYSHQEQVVVSMNDKPVGYGTGSGTQTFDVRGRPWDSDND